MDGKKKRVVILGSTGSIGENAVKVARHLADEIEVVGVAAGRNVEALARQASELHCARACVSDSSLHENLARRLPHHCRAMSGPAALVDLAVDSEVDMVLCAVSGDAGLVPVLEAIRAGKAIAIASKEILVAAGQLVMDEVKRNGVPFLPVDSEHSAVFQCLEGKRRDEVERIILTASGGPFRTLPAEQLETVTFESALRHPRWDMGTKTTIDSASMMNKALEIIEAKWLFDVPGERIEAIIHPQAIIHSMVEFIDGVTLAQMSEPDMRFPIQYALTHPVKHPHSLKPLDFAKLGALTFEAADRKRFPSLALAHAALESGGTMPVVMNAANQVAVDRFARGDAKFTDIWRIIEAVMSRHQTVVNPSLDDVFATRDWAVAEAEAFTV